MHSSHAIMRILYGMQLTAQKPTAITDYMSKFLTLY